MQKETRDGKSAGCDYEEWQESPKRQLCYLWHKDVPNSGKINKRGCLKMAKRKAHKKKKGCREQRSKTRI
jgi:hypothetical protein